MKIKNKLEVKERNIDAGDVVLYDDGHISTLGLVVDAETGFEIYGFDGSRLVAYNDHLEIDEDDNIIQYWTGSEVVMTLEKLVERNG